MDHVEVQGRVGPDGILNVRIPMGPDAANRDVRVIVDASSAMTTAQWQQFIDRVAGSIRDETFQRQPQGEFEQRGELFP